MRGTHWSGVSSAGASPEITPKSTPTPSSDIATTKSPDTAPPRSAICSAPLSELVAAAAVRMFVRMLTHIPM